MLPASLRYCANTVTTESVCERSARPPTFWPIRSFSEPMHAAGTAGTRRRDISTTIAGSCISLCGQRPRRHGCPADFVECGVDTGMFSLAICDWLDFNSLDKDFWLFDTFNGIPDEQMSAAERNGIGGWHNRESYEECFGRASANFEPWPRCRLVRGIVPQTLVAFPEGRKVAYLSLDMNIVVPEIAAIEFFWDRLVPGAVVLLDDYGWATHAAQKAAFDTFARAHGAMILSVPTGQGIIIR